MEKLMQILKQIKPEIDFENNKNLVDDGLIDSIEIVEIINEIEEQFGIEIAPNQIDPDNFQSVEAMYKLISENISK